MDGAPPTRRLAALRSALVPLTQRVAAVTTSGASSTGISIYEELGVQTIINANGPSTRLSGGIPRPEVVDAMARAAESCVDIAHLQGRASEIISELTGAEAGYVTAGAAAGLLLGTAACITRLDPTKMNALPDLTGLKHEVVMARSHRNFYDKAVRSVGVTLVEVGLSDRHAGAGVRDAEPWEFAAAITDNTAAVLYVMNDGMQPSLEEVIEVAHAAGVPVLVDAAAQALPPSNLRKYIDMGADLVAFSGGKVIGGPQASGVLCGRKELVGAAALQHLDQDIYWEQWVPPAQLIDKDSMVGTPHHGIGRVAKVGRETIVGLLVALQLFVAEDPTDRWQRHLGHLQELAAGLQPLTGLGCTLELSEGGEESTPGLKLTLPEEKLGLTAMQAVVMLQAGDEGAGRPAVAPKPPNIRDGALEFGPVCLRPGDALAVAAAVRSVVESAALVAGVAAEASAVVE